MNDHSTELAEHRAQLQAKAAVQRAQLGMHFRAIEADVSGADRVLLRARAFLHRPVLLAGGAMLLMWMGPRRVLALTSRAVWLVPIARRLLTFMR